MSYFQALGMPIDPNSEKGCIATGGKWSFAQSQCYRDEPPPEKACFASGGVYSFAEAKCYPKNAGPTGKTPAAAPAARPVSAPARYLPAARIASVDWKKIAPFLAIGGVGIVFLLLVIR